MFLKLKVKSLAEVLGDLKLGFFDGKPSPIYRECVWMVLERE